MGAIGTDGGNMFSYRGHNDAEDRTVGYRMKITCRSERYTD